MSASAYPPIEYTPQEIELITQFRMKTEDLGLSTEQQEDSYLIRWLRARNLDVDKAYDMLKTSLAWRTEHQVDNILTRVKLPDGFRKVAKFANCGLDKEGRLILIVPMGRQDGRGLLEQYGPDQFYQYNLFNAESIAALMKRYSEEIGRPVTQYVQIFDLEGYNYRQFASKAFREFSQKIQLTFDANYPEVFAYGCAVNAPTLFYVVFNMFKPFIPKRTLEKLDIYGPDQEKWKKAIAQKFPMDQIPPKWGGTREGADEYCSTDDIWLNGPLDLALFSSEGISFSDEDSDMTTVTVNARDKLSIPLDVKNPNSVIVWRFWTQEHDIGFQIDDPSGKVVLPLKRVESQRKMQEDTLTCTEQGKYTIIFDNSFSYTRSKCIKYHLDVLELDQDVMTSSENPSSL